jgi:outer membrane receptor protein involved in Fe transport
MKHLRAIRSSYSSTRTATAVAASLLCSISASAYAQDAATEVNADTVGLNKVIVTANKREQAAIDVPASVSAISAERLALGGATRLEDFVAQIPGMAITAGTRGQTVVTLRGIGTGSAQAMPTTAQYIDDAPIGSINAYASGSKITPDLDPYDLRRVEVLKGPQGTLYGAGAVGGLVRYVTVPANTQRFSGTVAAGANRVSDGGDGSNLRAAVNIPVVKDVLGLRVSAFDRTEAGYIDNPNKGQADNNKARIKGGRVAFDLMLNSDWSARAWALTQNFKSNGVGSEDVVAPGLSPLNGPLQRIAYVTELQDISLDVANVAIKGQAFGFDLVSSTTYQTSKAHRVEDNTVGSTGLLKMATGVPGLGAFIDTVVDTRRATQEFRARSTALNEQLEYEVGMVWTKENDLHTAKLPPPFFAATGIPTPLPDLGNGTITSSYEEYSFFGNASYSLTPQFSLLAGIRRGNDTQHFDLDYKASALSPSPIKLVQDVDHSKMTYMLGANYKIQPETSLYGRVATGYRPGGPSGLAPGLLPNGKASFEPDELTSYELGYKSAFLGGKASIEAALFSTDWQNIQLMASAPPKPPQTYIALNYGTNGGSARSNGAEATVLLFPTSHLTLRANAAYTDTRLTSAAPAVGGLDGDAMPYVPKWSSSIGAEYRFALGAAQGWVGGTLSNFGKRTSNYSQMKPVALPAYTTLTLNGGVDFRSVRVGLYGKNLTNARGINFAGPIGDQSALNPSGNPYTAAVIQPRTIGVDLSYRF